MNLLKVSHISKRYGATTILKDVCLEIDDQNKVIGLIGPNGAGKSTLLEIISGSIAPDSGQVYFKGSNITKLPPYKRARLGIARTFQKMELFFTMNAYEHIYIGLKAKKTRPSLLRDILGLSKASDEEIVEVKKIADALGLSGEDCVKPVESLSLGLQRIVELARAIASQPNLILLDEPSSGLDQTERNVVINAIKSISEQASVILVEHDLEVVRLSCEKLYLLSAGQLLTEGKTSEVLKSDLVKEVYFGITK